MRELDSDLDAMVDRLNETHEELRNGDRVRRQCRAGVWRCATSIAAAFTSALKPSPQPPRRPSRLAARRVSFSRGMSHEIRTPINGVVGIADLLLSAPLDPDLRGLAETLRSSGQILASVINDVLDFSKIDAGEVDVERLPFSPRGHRRRRPVRRRVGPATSTSPSTSPSRPPCPSA
ncbi:MAG: histidine kinase dimerization/phospho-acceptor domain-containing protein [Vicinamibacterales bacterium]